MVNDQGKIIEICNDFLIEILMTKVAYLFSHVLYRVCAQSGLTLCGAMDSSAHGIFQGEYWSGVPFPTPRDFC